MRIRKLTYLLVISWVLWPGEKQAAGSNGGSPEDSLRTERLAGVCRLWGTVKYFHPYLAYRDIDWDSALVAAIPRVKAARTPDEFGDAVARMLGLLNDPNTRIVAKTEEPPALKRQKTRSVQPTLRWVEDSTALISMNDYSQFLDFSKFSDLEKVMGQVSGASAIVFDLRALQGRSHTDRWINYLLYRTLPAILPRDISLSSTRHVMHSGYRPQIPEAGFFYTGFVTREGALMKAAGGRNRTGKLIFLIDGGTVSCTALLAGLQSSGLAAVIEAGVPAFETGIETYRMALPGGLQAEVRTTEIVNPDGTLGFRPDTVLAYSPDSTSGSDPALSATLRYARSRIQRRSQPSSPPLFRPDKLYSEISFPGEGLRLLALFRFWNVINYFYPYKDLLGRPWEGLLPEFIPKFEASKDSLEYALTVAEMVSRIHDTHGFIRSPVLQKYYGTHLPPTDVRFTEGRTILTSVPDSLRGSARVFPGDELLSVDGEEAGKRRERIARTISASTPQALEWRVDQILLRGSDKSIALLKIKRSDGTETEIRVQRSLTSPLRKFRLPVFSVLPEGFGYIDLTRLAGSQADEALEKIKNTKGAVLDMRGYPNGTIWELAPRFAKKSAVAALFRRPELHGPDTSMSSYAGFSQAAVPGPDWIYPGKVAVMINEETMSQGEHMCLFLEAAADVKFIGSPTNGTNGDMTTMFLPAGIIVNFSGHEVRHGDGRQLQRMGIQPSLRVEPSIQGIREGRDEVLEKAVEYLRES